MKFRKLSYSFFILISMLWLPSIAQTTTVRIKADTLSIRIGEQIKVSIDVNETKAVVFPKFKVDSLGKIEVVKSLPVDSLKSKLSKTYILTSFDSGVYTIPEQEVFVNKQKYVTKELSLKVATVAVDTTKQKMFPIKAVKKEPKILADYQHLFWWLLALLAVIAIILYFILKKKQPKPKPKVYVSPIAEAMQRLKVLDEQQFIEQRKIKTYYSELTNIVRTYIEKDTHIPALESTTGELLETMRDINESSNLGISSATLNNLESVLQNADFVKFAKATPLPQTIKADRQLIENVITSTQQAMHKNDTEKTDSKMQSSTVKKSSFPWKRTPSEWNNKGIALVLIAIVVIGIMSYFAYKKLSENSAETTNPEMNKVAMLKPKTQNQFNLIHKKS